MRCSRIYHHLEGGMYTLPRVLTATLLVVLDGDGDRRIPVRFGLGRSLPPHNGLFPFHPPGYELCVLISLVFFDCVEG